MTPTRLRECLESLHWSQRGLARIIGYSEGTVRCWARGRIEVPQPVAEWLEKCALFMQETPAPVSSRELAE